MVEIRNATASDIQVLLPLVEGYWRFESLPGFDAGHVALQLRYLLSKPRLGDVWLAMRDDMAVGYLIAVYVYSLEHLGITAEIDEFFVLPDHRSRGIGAVLLETAESVFLQQHCTNVSLQLASVNRSSREFYHAHGYAERSGYELLDKNLRDARRGKA